MIDIRIAILLVVATINIIIGLIVFTRQKEQAITVPFIFFTFGISLWALTNALFQLTTNVAWGTVYAIASYYSGLMLSASFFSLSLNFPKPLSTKWQKRLDIFLWIYCIVWALLILWPQVTLIEVVYDPAGRIVTGPGLWFYAMSLCFFLFGGIFDLWRKRKVSGLTQRRQINLIVVGMIISAVLGISCNVILPVLGSYEFVWLGPDFALILVAFMAYAIIKHNLFEVRVLATELFAGLLGIAIFVLLLESTTQTDLMIRGSIFVIYAFLSWQLLSSVYKEIKARETLQHLLEQKTDFINMASHQLRSPLTAIRGLLTMLHDGDYDHDSPEKKKQVLKNALISSERLSRVVNDLLEAAELEKGMLGEVATESVAPLVQQSIDTLRTNYEQKKVRLNYHAPKQSLPLCKMRTRYLQQVFVNLIDNAQRYTPKGGQVDVRLYVNEQHQIVFETKDSGIGIAEEDVPKLFNKFYRADNAKEIQSGGTGLGLYIVKQIVEDHGGSVEVHSAGLGLGTLFRVILPAAV